MQSLDSVFEFLEDCISSYKLDESVSFAFKVAVEEIFTNMVKYNPLGPDDVLIAVDADAADLTVRCLDFESEPFDMTRAKNVDLALPIERREPGGLGIHLIRNMVDTLDYEHEGGRSTVTFTLKLGRRDVQH